MYTWIWRHLPGPLAVRLFVVFPWLEPRLPIDHVTVGGN